MTVLIILIAKHSFLPGGAGEISPGLQKMDYAANLN